MTNLSVNQVFRQHIDGYEKENPGLPLLDKKVIRSIQICRTKDLGGRIEKCDECGHKVSVFHSCRNRHCPQCQFLKKEKWILERQKEVLPYQYFHVVFTVPHELNQVIYSNKKLMYDLFFQSVNLTLQGTVKSNRKSKLKIGFFCILHTWDQKLSKHYHIHCVVPGGGFDEKKGKWKCCSQNYLVPIDVARPIFSYHFLTGLRKLHKDNKLYLDNTPYHSKYRFQKLMDKLFSKTWNVFTKKAFNNSDSVVKYLAQRNSKTTFNE